MPRTSRVLPFPKRLIPLIRDYQAKRDPKDLERILRLIDKLLIRIIQQIYKYRSYSYLSYRDPDEIYHVAILALIKVILKIKPDEDFTIKKLSSYLSGYIAREFQREFSKDVHYVCFEVDEDEVKLPSVVESETFSVEEVIDRIKTIKPDFPDDAMKALKMTLIEERSLQDIADTMGVKKGCVRSWVNRGKTILKNMIEKERKQGLWRSS